MLPALADVLEVALSRTSQQLELLPAETGVLVMPASELAQESGIAGSIADLVTNSTQKSL